MHRAAWQGFQNVEEAGEFEGMVVGPLDESQPTKA